MLIFIDISSPFLSRPLFAGSNKQMPNALSFYKRKATRLSLKGSVAFRPHLAVGSALLHPAIEL
jgi:hypothetical protein